MRILGFDVRRIPPAAKPPAADDARVYQDCCILLVRAFSGKPWSRRLTPIPNRRWNEAFNVLQAAGIVTGSGPITHEFTTCLFLLWKHHADKVQLQAQHNYVSSTPPKRPSPK